MARTACRAAWRAPRWSSPCDGARGVAGVSVRSVVCQMRRELLPDGVRDRRFVVRKARESGTQRAFTRRTQFATDRIVVMQIERAQERLERQSLDHQRAEDDRERGQHDQVAIRKRRRERQCRGERDDAAHAGPRNDQAAPDGRPQHRPWRMKPEPAVPPPDDGIEGHVPGEAHDDDGQQDRAGDGEVPPAVRGFQALENRPNLQADEDERQDVQREHDRLPHGIRRDAYACGNALRRGPRHRDRVAHHRQHT